MPVWEHLEPHLPHVYRFALRLSGDADVAEDLTQETFLRAWKRRRTLQNVRSARVWLFRIAANLWRDRLRQGTPPARSGMPLAEVADPVRAPQEAVIQQEEVQQALRAAESLPPRQRDVLYLAAVEELSPAEIGEVLDISPNAARVHLCEARKTMRRLLTPAPEDVPSTESP